MAFCGGDHFSLFTSIDESSDPIAVLGSEFTTESGISVSVQRKDIAQVYADCVVSAVDKHISLSGGVSKRLAKAAGRLVKEECAGYIKQNKCLPLGQVFASSGGQRWKHILHACGPRWEDFHDKKYCLELLTDTLYNCFIKASQLGHTSIAVPAVSSGSFKVPIEQSAKCYLSAITRYDKASVENKLKNILFVDVAEDKVSELQDRLHISTSIKESETLRLVLVGKTGVGKSNTGNMILSQDCFGVSHMMSPETAVSSMGKRLYLGQQIEVVDTPGLFDAEEEEEDGQTRHDRLMKEILKSIIFSLPGPHVFCLLFRADERYTKAEVEVYKQLEGMFQVELKKFLMVVLTHSPLQGDYSLKNVLSKRPKSFDKLLTDVERRVVGIDSKEPQVQQQVEALLQMAMNIKNQNGADGTPFYTNSLVNRCLQLVQSGKFAKKSLEDIKEEVRLQSKSEVVDYVMQDKKVKESTEKTECCTIL